jgi:hypothetical protein
MKRIILLLLCGFVLFISSCSKSEVARIDKVRKAIVASDGQAFKKVLVQGDGKDVTFQGFTNDQANNTIYFNRVNAGFMVSEGFGLNKNYILRLTPGKKYTVYIYTDPKDASAYPIHFRVDYNGNIVTAEDDDKDDK